MRLNHVMLIVEDLDVSMSFCNLFGQVTKVLQETRYVRFIFPSGDETLSLEVTAEPAAVSRAAMSAIAGR